MRKPKGKINPALWDETKDSHELARLMNVHPHTVQTHARKFGLRYKPRRWGKGVRGGTRVVLDATGNRQEDTTRLTIIRDLVKRFHKGSDEAGRELQNYGIKAERCEI